METTRAIESAPLEPSEPGTLLWVGPTGHSELVDAYRYCRDQVSQIAVRKSLSEALSRPAGYVRRIVFARPTRQMPRHSVWRDFMARYGRAPAAALCGSLCDGEPRTGTPWAVDRTIRFSRWQELLPNWLSDCGVTPPTSEPGRSLLVISDRMEMAEPYLLWADALSLTTAWQRKFIPALHRSFTTVLWDDSSARPASAAVWRQRLGGGVPPERAGADDRRPPVLPHRRHLWIALQPSIAAIRQATRGGITRVLTKPARIESIFEVV